MGLRLRRYAIMVVALSVLSVGLVACQTSTITGNGGSGVGKNFTLITPGPGDASPTPTFPPFTIGAWPSNFSPNNPDTITIYAICRVQDQSMQNPPTPPNPGVSVTFLIGAPINQSATVTTGSDGIATTQVAFSDSNPGTPVTVTVTAQYKGGSYTNETFFTPGALFTPTPTAGPNSTPGAGGTPTATP